MCIILTAADVFPDDPDEIGFKARSDVRIDAFKQAAWFYVPYPGKTIRLPSTPSKARVQITIQQ